MSSAPDGQRLLAQLSSLPLETHPPGSLVLAAGSSTGKLLVLREGAVEVVIDGERIAQVSEPGAVFGELALLLGRPHGADVRALRPTTFHVADAASYLRADPGSSPHRPAASSTR
jgi:CRP/FNR family cyclic AMP-dependent transcriptional regulator